MYYLGIDLGGTNIAAGVLDDSLKIVGRASRKTEVPCSQEALCEKLELAARDALKEAGASMEDIPWIGVGCPGSINSAEGMVEYSTNLFFDKFPLGKMLKERTGKEIFVDNDANAAAYGEFMAGALRGAQNALAITLGTGIGSGIVLDGKIYSGRNGAAGEMGHMVIVHGGRLCNCGRHGCWERYASATGLILTTKEMMADASPESPIWKLVDGDIEKVSGRTAFDAMRAGDPVGKKIVDIYIEYLGCGLANVVNTFQPDIICIGGGICHEGETLLAPLREYVDHEQYTTHSAISTKLCRAELGNDAGIIGAALLGK